MPPPGPYWLALALLRLSKEKYCSVSAMLEKTAVIGYEIVYPGGDPED